MADKIICASCGAEVDAECPRCPYCDTLLVPGAQKEYMGKLEQVRSDMEELTEIPGELVKEEIGKQKKRIRKTVLITAAAAVVLFLLFLLEDRKYERDNKADYIWGEQNFPVMSEMYEEGKLEELESFYYDALINDKPVWNWEYYDAYSVWLEEQE